MVLQSGTRIFRKLVQVLICFALTSLIACSSSSHVKRGNLSEAAEKSSDSYDGERKVENSQVNTAESKGPSILEILIDLLSSDSNYQDDVNQGSYKASKQIFTKSHIGIRTYSSVFQESQLKNEFGSTYLLGGFIGSKNRFTTGLGFGLNSISKNNRLQMSFTHVGHVHFLFQFRRYSEIISSKNDLYYQLELVPKSRFWKFKNPIYSDVYDENGVFLGKDIIKDDKILSCSFETGVGYRVLKFSGFEIELDLNTGVNLLSSQTYEGFTNDLFYDEIYIRLGVEINLQLNH